MGWFSRKKSFKEEMTPFYEEGFDYVGVETTPEKIDKQHSLFVQFLGDNLPPDFKNHIETLDDLIAYLIRLDGEGGKAGEHVVSLKRAFGSAYVEGYTRKWLKDIYNLRFKDDHLEPEVEKQILLDMRESFDLIKKREGSFVKAKTAYLAKEGIAIL